MDFNFSIGKGLNFGFAIPKGSSGGGESVMLSPVGVLEFDATATSSKLEILHKEYAVGAVGTMEFLADLAGMLEWDSHTYTEGSPVAQYYKGNISISATPSANYTVGTMAYQQESGSISTAFGNSAGATSDNTSIANFVKWADGFSVCFTAGVATGVGNTNENIGVCKCKNVATSEEGWCIFRQDIYASESNNIYVLSANAYSANASYQNFDSSANDFSIAHPLYSTNSPEIPDGLLMIRRYQSESMAECGFCRLNGKLYYKNGGILIPAE